MYDGEILYIKSKYFTADDYNKFTNEKNSFKKIVNTDHISAWIPKGFYDESIEPLLHLIIVLLLH